MVANQSCSWSAQQGKLFFTCPRSRLRIWFRETDSAVPPRFSPLIFYTRAESGPYSRDFSRFPRRRPFIMYAANRHRISPEFIGSSHAIAYRWRSLPKGRRRRAGGPQGSSSNRGCCLFRFHHGLILPLCASLVEYIYVYVVDISIFD